MIYDVTSDLGLDRGMIHPLNLVSALGYTVLPAFVFLAQLVRSPPLGNGGVIRTQRRIFLLSGE